jgi:hypothetical protein
MVDGDGREGGQEVSLLVVELSAFSTQRSANLEAAPGWLSADC